MADILSPILGALGGIGSAIFGSSKGDKSLSGNYLAPSGNGVGWKDGQLAMYDKDGKYAGDYMSGVYMPKIPKSVYWSIMMNQANQQFSEKMWNAQNEYNTPFNQAQRLRAAGLNPYLAMQNEGSIGQAQSAQVSQGSVDTSSGQVDASLAASRNQLVGSVGNQIQAAVANLNQAKINDATAEKVKAEKDFQLIQNQFAYADMTLRLHKAIADTKDVDARRQYQEILNYITDSSKEFFISKNQSDATNALNETTLQEDEHNLNIASIRAKKLEGDLLQANLAWLPREKAALISQAYAQAYAATASGKAAVQAAENTAQEAYGKRFDNKMRDQLHDVILNSEKSRYNSQSTALDVLKERLKMAKKENNSYEIRLIGDMIAKIAGAAGSIAH
jgi:hypothetical protein